MSDIILIPFTRNIINSQKFCGRPRESCGTLLYCGTPVENHWSRPTIYVSSVLEKQISHGLNWPTFLVVTFKFGCSPLSPMNQ